MSRSAILLLSGRGYGDIKGYKYKKDYGITKLQIIDN
jgi:hypothetical protein